MNAFAQRTVSHNALLQDEVQIEFQTGFQPENQPDSPMKPPLSVTPLIAAHFDKAALSYFGAANLQQQVALDLAVHLPKH
ncbi:MAG: hypothetical protein KKB45_07980, partial [Gammaproteobacteria bacterium]|nr:hypothetical protein [Gammaproteobacteria bacterium]